MAAVQCILNKCQFFKFQPGIFSAFIQQNGMSQYPKYYIVPIHKPKEQEEMYKSGEAQKLIHVPTRAALNDQTCSNLQDNLVNQFINYIMGEGKKALARDLMEKTFEKIKRVQLERYHKAKDEEAKAKVELNPRTIMYKAIDNCKPILTLTRIKRGGVTYQVPVPITAKHSQFRSMKWLIEAAKDKDANMRFYDKFAYELIDAANNTGRVIKRKQDLHRQCEANRAYAHYRWS